MNAEDFEFLEIVRSLVLPVPANAESSAVEALRQIAEERSLETAEISAMMRLESRKWETSGAASQPLQEVVRAVLRASLPKDRFAIADKYFDLHRIAVGKPDHLSHLSARYLLSHLNLIVMLAREEAMSASQIVRILRARDERVCCSWKILLGILTKIGVENRLEFKAFKQLFRVDRLRADAYLADSPIDEAIGAVADSAGSVGFDGDLGELLRIVFLLANGRFIRFWKFCIIRSL